MRRHLRSLARAVHRSFTTLMLLLIRALRARFYNTPVHRSRLANAVYKRLLQVTIGTEGVTEVQYEGHTFRIPRRDTAILPSLLNGDYEQDEVRVLRQVLKPGMTFVDVGANIGIFTVVGAHLVGPSGAVVCFEPEPSNYRLLLQNLARNGVTNVRAENVAVGARAETRTLHLEGRSIATHSLLTTHRTGRIEAQIEVNVVRLDEHLTPDIERIDLLKIDVEGYEPFVLEGAESILDRVGCVLFEFTREDVEASYGLDATIELLQRFPYLYAMDGRQRGLRAITARELTNVAYANILAARCSVDDLGTRVASGGT